MKSMAVCLLFVQEQAGKAEEAIRMYTSLFANSEIVSIEHNGEAEAPEVPGTVKMAHFVLGGVAMMAMDSALEGRQFTFTPATSLFVECESEAELETACERLAEGGEFLMPLGDYGFSRRFAWLADRYGVNWQLNLS